MRVEFIEEQGIVVTPSGLFDYCAGHDCIPEVEKLIVEHSNAPVTVDFSDTTFLDSSGIGALIALSRKLPYDSPRVRLLRPSSTVQKLLEICHLHRLFDIEPRQE